MVHLINTFNKDDGSKCVKSMTDKIEGGGNPPSRDALLFVNNVTSIYFSPSLASIFTFLIILSPFTQKHLK